MTRERRMVAHRGSHGAWRPGWRRSRSIFAGALAVILSLAGPTRAAAQVEVPSPPVDVDAQLEDARSLVSNAQYDKAIRLLEALLESIRPDRDRLEQTYLLLIESYVYSANDTEDQDLLRDLAMEKADELVRECLSIPALRHTRPDLVRSPKEMIELFDMARREMFGKVLLYVDPPEAEIVLDGEKLQPAEDGTCLVEDVPLGPRTLLVRHPDRKTRSEDVAIGAGEVLVREIRLEKKRGVGWYATRVVLPVGVAGTLVAVLAGGGGGDNPGEEVLGGDPPGPPTP